MKAEELETQCPFCHRKNDQITSVDEPEHTSRPEDGDAVCCIRCGFPALVVIEAKNISLRPFADAELDEALLQDDNVLRNALIILLGPRHLERVKKMNQIIIARTN